MKRLVIIIVLCAPCFGQAWSGILSTSRAIDWTTAGLTSTFVDGETTLTPWSPPTRTLCTTIHPIGGGSDDGPQMLTAAAGCAAGTYVQMGSPGETFTLTTQTNLSPANMSGHNNVTWRGSGPMSTTMAMASGGFLQIGIALAGGNAPFTAASGNYTVGATSAIITTASPPSVGMLAYITQCDTGTSWNGSACTGTPADNSGLFICGFSTVCQTSSGLSPDFQSEQQYVRVTSVTNSGGGTYTVGFTPGLRMRNWSFGQTTQLYWFNATYTGFGLGLEDMTVTYVSGAASEVTFNGCYDCWVKGVRFIGASINGSIGVGPSAHTLIFNNYIFGQNPTPASPIKDLITQGQDSDDLILNNILIGGIAVEGEGHDSADVFAYNYGRDVQTSYNQSPDFQHTANASFLLREGNRWVSTLEDNTWGTHNLNTWFRDYIPCWDVPYTTLALTTKAVQIDNFARFENIIGNALGGTPCTTYQGTATNGDVFVLPTSDTVAQTSMMRWGNYDVVSNAARWCGNSSNTGWVSVCASTSEVPTALSGNAAPFNNAVPATQTLPPSFFLPVAAAHSNGGTGLSWWKVCTSWSSFPSSCSGSVTKPFPPVGPDVTSGPYINGFAYDAPAGVAYGALPVDTTYQASYTVTGSSWAASVETLTVSGLPNIMHLMGGFRLSGANASCVPASGISFTGRSDNEILMSNSTSTTIIYSLPGVGSDPGCTGTMLWPDVRKFDEGIFQNDASATVAPTCDHTSGTYGGAFTNICSTISTGTVILCWSTSTLPVTNGAGTGCTTGTSMTNGGSTTISSTETFNIVAGTSTLADSPETTYSYTINASSPGSIRTAGTISTAGTVMTGVPVQSNFTLEQIYNTNTNTNQGTDDFAGFFTNVRVTGHFTPSQPQVAGTTVILTFSSQAASIASGQTIAATDSLGNTYTHSTTSCPMFNSGNAKVLDCLVTTNAVGGAWSGNGITVTITTPVTAGERVSMGYAEGLRNTGLGTLDGPAGQINLTSACGAPGSPCVGPSPANFTLTGNNDFCVVWIVDGPTQASVSSPWNANYANNGDHSAMAAAVGLTSSWSAPQWTGASSSNAAAEGVCVF